jgi:hypothetical protein
MMANDFIGKHIQKFGVSLSADQWLARHHVQLQVHNGEEKLPSPYKFDRIICNLGIMLT